MAKGIKTGGRKLGTPNKVTNELREVAQEHTPAAIKTLAEICEKGESEAARVAAANSLLDRGHGKPAQPVTADIDMNVRGKAAELTDAELMAIAAGGLPARRKSTSTNGAHGGE